MMLQLLIWLSVQSYSYFSDKRERAGNSFRLLPGHYYLFSVLQALP